MIRILKEIEDDDTIYTNNFFSEEPKDEYKYKYYFCNIAGYELEEDEKQEVLENFSSQEVRNIDDKLYLVDRFLLKEIYNTLYDVYIDASFDYNFDGEEIPIDDDLQPYEFYITDNIYIYRYCYASRDYAFINNKCINDSIWLFHGKVYENEQQYNIAKREEF